MPYNPRNPLWLLYMLAVYAPPLFAVVYGVLFCLRHRHRKPQTVAHYGTAIALMVASAAPTIVMPLAAWWGIRLVQGSMSIPFPIIVMQSSLLAMGLVLLFRVGYLEEMPIEDDAEPPVYRNDDGPPADG